MDATDRPLTLAVSTPEPYLHVDNRALVLHDGRSCVMYGSSSFPWIAETLRVLRDEKRATRQQGPQLFGGFAHDGGGATIYAGSVHHLATVTLSEADLQDLHAKLGAAR